MTPDTPSDQLEQINDRFDRIDARLGGLRNDMATMRDLRVAMFLSTIFWTATASFILWVAI